MRKFIQVLVLIFICGCDIFTLRQAEEPLDDDENQWNNFYYAPGLTLQNLELGYENERYLAKYSDLFMPNFRFYFSPQDVNDYNISMTWTRDKERDMLYNFHNLVSNVSVELDSILGQPDDLQSTPIKLYREYKITVIKDKADSTIYKGKLEIQMLQESGFWRILNWYDYRSDSPVLQPSWGKLKYDYAV